MKQTILLILIALTAAFNANAYDFEVDGIYYNINGDEAIVTYETSSYNSYSGTVVIPETVSNAGTTYIVAAIGDLALANCSGLLSVTIPNSVTTIGKRAFINCTDLSNLTIPNSVTTIDDLAFSSCFRLTSLIIPSTVTFIGYRVFDGCSDLTSIIVESGNPNYDSRNSCNAIIKTRTNTLLTGCRKTIIPNSVTAIGDYAFCDCDLLTSITIPNSVTSIGNRAFYTCDGLSNITIPSSVTSISTSAFHACSTLSRITVESGNPIYDSRNNCNAIIETESNTLIVGCRSSSIPNTVTAIGDSAFYECYYFTNLNIPNSVTTIGKCAFYDCNMTSVTMPNSITSIGHSAFSWCSNLKSVTLPNSITSINGSTFYYCI